MFAPQPLVTALRAVTATGTGASPYVLIAVAGLILATHPAFPSGHTTTPAMAAGMLIVALTVRRPPGHRTWIALIICWATLVGASRFWLGFHRTTDVIAGWKRPLAWTTLGAGSLAKALMGGSSSTK